MAKLPAARRRTVTPMRRSFQPAWFRLSGGRPHLDCADSQMRTSQPLGAPPITAPISRNPCLLRSGGVGETAVGPGGDADLVPRAVSENPALRGVPVVNHASAGGERRCDPGFRVLACD
jgi:hypothetical protein